VLLAYIDDSKDRVLACFSAIVIPDTQWLTAERLILSYRRKLHRSDGVHKELHATDFVAGRGNLGCLVTKWRRARIFEEALTFVTSLPEATILSACVPRHLEDVAFERLTGRLNEFAMNRCGHVMLISDEGKDYTPLLRRMRRVTDRAERIVEDIVYRDSKDSTFIQLADFCAYALLRFQNPTAKTVAAGLDRSFLLLRPVLATETFDRDPNGLGIIREF
jgi:hypothetical protein